MRAGGSTWPTAGSCGAQAGSGGSEYGSDGSGPTTASSASATSRIRRAIGPFTPSRPEPGAFDPPLGTRPCDGLSPDRPHSDDGMRIAPPPSEPVASGTMPATTAAPAPPDEPP